jgi:hypothetical protein
LATAFVFEMPARGAASLEARLASSHVVLSAASVQVLQGVAAQPDAEVCLSLHLGFLHDDPPLILDKPVG